MCVWFLVLLYFNSTGKNYAIDEERRKYIALKQAYIEASKARRAYEEELIQKNEESEQVNFELTKANEKLNDDLIQTH